MLPACGWSGSHPFVRIGIGSLRGAQLNPRRNGLERKGVGSSFLHFHLPSGLLSRHRQQFRKATPTARRQAFPPHLHRRAKIPRPNAQSISVGEDSRLDDKSPRPARVHPESARVAPSPLIHRLDIVSNHIGCQVSSFHPAVLNA